jgi:hypothetical protein
VYPLDPHEDDIDIEDIAHSLSMQCRFGGHTREFYSVAQHCVLLCERGIEYNTDEDAFAILMHDASEAYLIDFPRPVKALMPGYAEAENVMMRVINAKYGIVIDDRKRALIKRMDDAILYDESRELLPNGSPFVDRLHDVPTFRIDPWPPDRAKRAFLYFFNTLKQGVF